MQIKDIKYILFIMFILFTFACDNDSDNSGNYNIASFNVFNKNETLCKINDYQQSKDVTLISQFLNTTNSSELSEAILSLAVIADSNEISIVLPYLKNDDAKVRSNAAFALGQSYSFIYEDKLIEAYNAENDDFVKQEILIALGKCGKSTALAFVVSTEIANSNVILLEGQGRAFFYFAKNGFISNQLIDRAIQVVSNANISQDAKVPFSYFLSVLNTDLSAYFNDINTDIKSNSNVYLLSNLVLSLKNVNSTESMNLLKNIVNDDFDYRVKISAIKALSNFGYNDVKNTMFEAVKSTNSGIAKTAAEFFLKKGNKQDAQKYFDVSKQIVLWQARTTMISAALQYSSNKAGIVNSVISGYNAVENRYEKAALLYALSAVPSQYKFVKNEAFSADDYVISQAGIKSLYSMRLNPNFDAVATKEKQNGIDLYAEFKLIFKEAITMPNVSMVYYAAKIFNNQNLQMIDDYENSYFLTQAASSLKLPADYIAYNELCKAISLYGNQSCKDNPQIKPAVIDWVFANSIKSEQRVVVKTNKGDFEMTLDVNSAPLTVATFLQLVKNGYYNDTYFFKNVAGKAIVTGGKRGDGEMTSNISTIKEINTKNFKDGSVAMRNIFGDYQSVNWFVATAPVISYDNNFTIFAEISKGLDIVHKLEIGDKIIEINIL